MPTRAEISSKKNVYGWSAKVDFMLGQGAGFHDLDEPNVSLLWGQDYILRLERRKIHPVQEDAGILGYRCTIEAEDTASRAETLGTRLAFGLLSLAVERRWGLALSWPDSQLPCRVIDRTASVGFSMQAFGTVTQYMYLNDFISNLEQGFAKYESVPYRLLLSMELFTSSKLESNNRLQLIMLVSALEALAEQRDIELETGELVAKLVQVVEDTALDDADLKSSITGQVKNLTRESARRAIRRLLLDKELTPEDVSFVDGAYRARSKIVHEGKRVPELGAMVTQFEDVLVRLYRQL